VDTELMGRGYHTHEFGDSVLIERSRAAEADSTDATGALDRGPLVAIREP
jgi:hypothetical protein